MPKPPTNFKHELADIQKGLKVLEMHEKHPLEVYRPMPHQLPIHESGASEVLTVGGKRCLAGWQEIFDPVDGVSKRVDEIKGQFHVESLNPKTGEVEVRRASKPFIKGIEDIYRVAFSNGTVIYTTLGHRVVASDLQWKSIGEIWSSGCGVASLPHSCSARHKETFPCGLSSSPFPRESSSIASPAPHQSSATCERSDPCCFANSHQQPLVCRQPASGCTRNDGQSHPLTSFHTASLSPLEEAVAYTGFCLGPVASDEDRHQSSLAPCHAVSPPSAPYCWQTIRDYQGRCFADYRPYGEPPHSEAGICQSSFPSRVGAHGHSPYCRSVGGAAGGSRHSHFYQTGCRLSNWRNQGDEGCPNGCSDSTRPLGSSHTHRLFPGESFLGRYTTTESDRALDDAWFSSTHPEVKKANNKSDTSIISVEFVVNGPIYDITVEETANYMIGGIVSANSGKTLAVVMELGSRILGKEITRTDGSKIPLRFRAPTPKNPGLYWVIGYDINHIGQTLYHRLFSPGLGDGANFRIIRDEKTDQWRSYNPNTDRERYSESELSPPMIGEHMIDPKTWHFESRAGNVFRSVRLLNGATICAYPSTGDSPKKGDAVDGIWIDEDIDKGSFLKEWQDRLATNDGWFLWSVWPQVANEALVKTLERGEREKDNPDRAIEVFRLISQDNQYSDRRGIAKMLARMDDDDDAAHRAEGDISSFISGRQMYSYGSAIHEVYPREFENPDNAFQVICNLFAKDNRRLPLDWTRYLVIDPSHTRTACLVGVVPPPEYGDLGMRLILEEEIIVRKYTPAQFADEVKNRVGGLRFEAFIMDQRAGRQTTIGLDTTVFEAYSREFQKRGLQSRVTRYGFMQGSDDKALRRRCVRDLMEPTENGWPRLWFSHNCPITRKEVRNFRKKRIKDQEGNDVPTDDGEAERLYDAVAATEYLGEYVYRRFMDGTAYVEPANYKSTGSMAYHAAQGILQEIQKQSSGTYSHLGPGAAA